MRLDLTNLEQATLLYLLIFVYQVHLLIVSLSNLNYCVSLWHLIGMELLKKLLIETKHAKIRCGTSFFQLKWYNRLMLIYFALLRTKPNLIRVIIHIYQVLCYHGIYIKNMAQNIDWNSMWIHRTIEPVVPEDQTIH